MSADHPDLGAAIEAAVSTYTDALAGMEEENNELRARVERLDKALQEIEMVSLGGDTLARNNLADAYAEALTKVRTIARTARQES